MPGPTTLSQAEIDQYSIQYFVQSGLDSLGWTTVQVIQVMEGWPVYEDLVTPGVYVLCENSDLAGLELGSHGKSRTAFFYIYGENDAQRTRLADTIQDMVRDIIPIYNFTDGNETSAELSSSQSFETESVGWEKIPSTTSDPKNQKWRAVVTARLSRDVA